MEYVCSDPNAQVREVFVALIQKALAALPTLGRRFIEAHDLPTQNLSLDRFIPIQRSLDILRHVQDEMGPLVIRQIGSHVVSTFEYPPQLDSVEKVLQAMDSLYQANHQGNGGRYDFERRSDGALLVHCRTPYPREFERGLVEGVCRNEQLAKGQRYRVTSLDGPAGSDLTCTLTVQRI